MVRTISFISQGYDGFLAPRNIRLFWLVIMIFGKQNLNVPMFHNYTSNLS